MVGRSQSCKTPLPFRLLWGFSKRNAVTFYHMRDTDKISLRQTFSRMLSLRNSCLALISLQFHGAGLKMRP